MKNKTTSLIIFFTKDRKILLQDRKSISKCGEEWGFFGGGIEEDESPRECILRETKEELGVDLNEYNLTHLGTIDVTLNLPEKIIKNKGYLYIVQFDGDLDVFTLGEGDGMQLFSLDEARKLKCFSFDFTAYDMLKLWARIRMG